MADNEAAAPGGPIGDERWRNAPPPSPFEPPSPQYPPPPSPAHAPPLPPAPVPSQPHAPPPVAWSPAPPQKKSRKRLWITLGTILTVLVLGIGACSVWFVSTVKAPVDEANRFLAVVDAGDYPAALAMMTPSCDGSTITVDAFDQIFAGRSIDYNLTSSSVNTSTGAGTSATVSGTVTALGEQGAQRRIEVFLRDRDGWKVCGFNIAPRGG